MSDRKSLLGLAVAGLFVGLPAARSLAAVPVVRFATLTAAAAPDDDDDDDKKPAVKGEKKEEKEDDEKGEKGEKEWGEKHEKKIETDVPIAMVPQPVIDAVMKECPGGKITESELEAKHGKIMYGFDVKVGDVTYDVNISVDGKFVSKKVDDDGDNEKDEKDEKKPAMGEKK